MMDRTELRRYAELAAEASPLAKVTPFMDLTPETVLALLDAAERGERAIELLREAGRPFVLQAAIATGFYDQLERIDALLAEVDRAE